MSGEKTAGHNQIFLEGEEPKEICKLGQGDECCAYLVMGAKGFECVRMLYPYNLEIQGRLNAGTMVAKGEGGWKGCGWEEELKEAKKDFDVSCSEESEETDGEKMYRVKHFENGEYKTHEQCFLRDTIDSECRITRESCKYSLSGFTVPDSCPMLKGAVILSLEVADDKEDAE